MHPDRGGDFPGNLARAQLRGRDRIECGEVLRPRQIDRGTESDGRHGRECKAPIDAHVRAPWSARSREPHQTTITHRI
jgi:hypothetical protein